MYIAFGIHFIYKNNYEIIINKKKNKLNNTAKTQITKRRRKKL